MREGEFQILLAEAETDWNEYLLEKEEKQKDNDQLQSNFN